MSLWVWKFKIAENDSVWRNTENSEVLLMLRLWMLTIIIEFFFENSVDQYQLAPDQGQLS